MRLNPACAVWLVAAFLVCAATTSGGVAVSISELIDQYQRASSQCVLPADYTIDKSSASSFLLEKLSRCGFAVVRNVAEASLLASIRDEVVARAPVVGYDAQAYAQSGAVHLITEGTPGMKQGLGALLKNLVTLEHPPSVIAEYSANLYSGPSQDAGVYSRYPFIFPNEIMRRYHVSSADAAFPYRVDAYIATQALEIEPLIDVCAGSHLVDGLASKQDCAAAFQAVSPKRILCEFLAGTDQCLKENTVRVDQISVGDVVIVSHSALRRFGGSESDPRRVRVDVQSTIFLGEWWLNSDVFESLKAFPKQVTTKQSLDSCDNKTECSAEPSGAQESHGDEIPRLYFVNVDVPSVLIYQGTSKALGSIPSGSVLIVAPLNSRATLTQDAKARSSINAHASYAYPESLEGVYTVRVEGVVRNTWIVRGGNETMAFYITQDNFDHMST